MKNCNDHFVFDFADAVVIRESANAIRPSLTKIYANAAGRFDFSEPGCFSDYDLLVCCMNASPVSQITGLTVPIRYIRDVNESIDIIVTDNECNSVFTFNADGCTCRSYTGMNPGRIYAIYGIKF